MNERRLRILKIHAADVGGGVGSGGDLIVWNLFNEYRRRGHRSWLAVRWKRSADPDVFRVPHGTAPNLWSRAWGGLNDRLVPLRTKVRGVDVLRGLLSDIGHPYHRLNKWQGIEDFDFPGTWSILQLLPEGPDVVHCYDLQHDFFDLRFLPRLSHRVPTFLTLDDARYLSGHCAHSVPFYSFECERWKTGCGQCPDLTIPAAVRRDSTAFNWERKRRIFRESRLYIATPSRWLMRKVEQSILAAGAEDLRVIPNGLDLSVFHPGNKDQARQELGLPKEPKILLFTMSQETSQNWKDVPTMRAAVVEASTRPNLPAAVFVVLGGTGPAMPGGNASIIFVPYQSDRRTVARYYQAADVYLHAAVADTFPGAIAEAMACGTPVVATATGGIPELVSHGITGFLVPPRDVGAMADRVEQLLTDDALCKKMSTNAAKVAQLEFGIDRQVTSYLNWYREVCDAWNPAG